MASKGYDIMVVAQHLRVVIACVTFETVKVVEPTRYYKADKVHLLHKASKKPYSDFLEEIIHQLDGLGIRYECHELEILEFPPLTRKICKILKEENALGNHVYVNISSGPRIYSAAALIACMMEGGYPFDLRTKTFTIEPSAYYEDGRPIGLTKEVYDPGFLPEFSLNRPKDELVKGLMIWKQTKEKGGILTSSNIIQKLEAENLMRDVLDKQQRRVTQSAVMRYGRNFLEAWLKEGWLAKKDRGKYEITPKGEMILEIFGE